MSYSIITFGDSIAWGQGLLDNQKYTSLIASNIEKILNIQVDKQILAHSGAQIGYNLWPDDIEKKKLYGDSPIAGEVPTTFPTIDQQVQSVSQSTAHGADLIIMDGGINDVRLFDTIFSPTIEDATIENLTTSRCYHDMKKLLQLISQKFTNSKTRIVVTGYYRVVTKDTDLAAFGILVTALAALVGSLAGPLGAIIAGATGALTMGAYKNKVIKNFQIFEQVSNTSIAKAVGEIDANRKRFLFANPRYEDSNAIFSSNSYVWGLSAPIEPQDPVRESRINQCKSVGPRAPSYCRIGSVGHPNIKGSEAYARSIFSVLFPFGGWESLGGKLYSDPAAIGWIYTKKVRLVDTPVTRLDILVRSERGDLVQKFWDPITGWQPAKAGDPFGGWESLGLAGVLESNPVATSFEPNRLDIFWRATDGTLGHKYWNPLQGWQPTSRGGWESLGGQLHSGPAAVGWRIRKSIGGTTKLIPRLDVFVKAAAGDLAHKYWEADKGWQPAKAGDPSGGWESLGLAGQVNSDPVAVTWISKTGPHEIQRIDIFWKAANGTLGHKYWDIIKGWQPTSGGGWESLGGQLYSSPAACSWGPNRLDVFVKAAAGDLAHKYWEADKGWQPKTTDLFGGWESLGLTGELHSDPVAASFKSGRIDIFWKSSKGTLGHKYYDKDLGGWKP